MKYAAIFVLLVITTTACRTTDGSNPPTQDELQGKLKALMKDQPENAYAPPSETSEPVSDSLNQEE